MSHQLQLRSHQDLQVIRHVRHVPCWWKLDETGIRNIQNLLIYFKLLKYVDLTFFNIFFTYFYMMSLNLSSACALRVLCMCSGVATCITKPAGSRRRWAFDIFNLAHLVAFLETKVASGFGCLYLHIFMSGTFDI